MIDWSKPQPCQECGQKVLSTQPHSFEDCKKWKKNIQQNKNRNDALGIRLIQTERTGSADTKLDVNVVESEQ